MAVRCENRYLAKSIESVGPKVVGHDKGAYQNDSVEFVLDPGTDGKGKGKGSPDEWAKAMKVFGFKSEPEAMAYPGNPVDCLASLAAATVPILHVYGDADKSVPWEKNTEVLAERYRALCGDIKLIAKPGCGRHPI